MYSKLFFRRSFIALLLAAVSGFILIRCGDAEGSSDDFGQGANYGRSGNEQRGHPATPDPRMEGQRLHNIWPQVWSQHAPNVASWEYKVNCSQAVSHAEPCFLSDLTAVNVEAPDGSVTELDFDFNTNEYSGEVTRRWVKYGPPEGELPAKGDYTFRYWRNEALVFKQTVQYLSEPISYPTNVTWQRDGDDLTVNWSPPPEADDSMHYKALIWQVDDTPPILISKELEWDASSGILEDLPLLDGGTYSLNVAIYFSDGYAYSEYVIFDW
jgi:hypothetical protein